MAKFINELVAKVIKGAAVAGCETTSLFLTYEPQVPKQLLEENDSESRVDENV